MSKKRNEDAPEHVAPVVKEPERKTARKGGSWIQQADGSLVPNQSRPSKKAGGDK